MTSLWKIRHPGPKNIFLSADWKTNWSVWAHEQLFTTISGGAMVRQRKTAGFRLKSRHDIFVDLPSKCWWNETKFFSFIPLKQAIDFAQDTIGFQNLIMNLWSNSASLKNNGMKIVNIETCVLHKICSFCTNFIIFYLWKHWEPFMNFVW